MQLFKECNANLSVVFVQLGGCDVTGAVPGSCWLPVCWWLFKSCVGRLLQIIHEGGEGRSFLERDKQWSAWPLKPNVMMDEEECLAGVVSERYSQQLGAVEG